jgi:hypothetical protein
MYNGVLIDAACVQNVYVVCARVYLIAHLSVFGGEVAAHEGVENDERLVEVPDEDAFEVVLGSRRRVVLSAAPRLASAHCKGK